MALQTVIAGSRGLSLISGEAGIGKTRLAKEFEEWAAARGCKVLAGSCLPSAQIPYWVFLEALNDLFDEDARRKVDRASRLKEAAKRAAPDLMKAIPTVGLTAKASAVLFKEYRGEIEGAEAHKQHVLLLEVEWMLDESKDRRQLAAAYDLHRSLYLSMGDIEKALELILKAQSIFEEVDDLSGLSDAFFDLGALHFLEYRYFAERAE